MDITAKVGTVASLLGVLLAILAHNWPAAAWAFSSATWAFAAFLASKGN